MAAGVSLSALFVWPVAAHTHRHHHVAPVLAPVTQADDSSNSGFGPTAAGASAILIDAQSGAVLDAQGADVPRYPASLTKLMTLDLAFQALRSGQLSLDTQIPVSYHAASVEPVKLGLTPGDTIAVRDAILAMTTMSANDAATALGEYLGGGSEDRCAQLMSARARQLGMAQTHFANASGLPNASQVTTARDLALLARDIVVNFPEDQTFFEVTSFNFRGHTVYSNNNMLRSYPGATGMKTGYTDLARHNLVTSAMRGARVLIGVELHEPSWGDTYAQMTQLLDSGFSGRLTGNGPIGTPQIATAVMSAPVQRVAQTVPVPELPAPPPAPVRQATNHARAFHQGEWVAQLGVYTRLEKARIAAVAARQLRGVGVARVARIEKHGKTLWGAQLAGLSFDAAHSTCSVLHARGTSCHVLSVGDDHLAMLSPAPDGT
jgi:D-alanyl-D-alanine carboxypeptidase